MVDNSAALKEYEALWQEAIKPKQLTPAFEVKGVETQSQVMFLLPQFTRLADTLKTSKIIDGKQHKQMLAGIENLRDVIKTIDHEVLAGVIKSLK